MNKKVCKCIKQNHKTPEYAFSGSFKTDVGLALSMKIHPRFIHIQADPFQHLEYLRQLSAEAKFGFSVGFISRSWLYLK